MDIKKTAISRIAEPLSKGENVKKLLSLHIGPYINQASKAQILEDLKDIDKVGGTFLEWFGVLKGLKRPKTSLGVDITQHFFNVFNPDNVGFSDLDISKPLYFDQKYYFKVGDLEYKRIIKAYCKLTGFEGSIDEYSIFFKDIFGVDVKILFPEYDLQFLVENTNILTIDYDLVKNLTPILPATKNKFFISPHSHFSLAFDNIKGTKLDFESENSTSLYFLI